MVIFLLFILLLGLMGFSILRTFKNILFGKGDNHKENSRRRPSGRRQQTQHTPPPPSPNKKIFSREDGEYVDYEEVK
jgi:hypothetical protein